MYKSICAVAVAAALAFAYGARSVGATSNLLTPQIVTSGQLLNQTAGFSKTIFTPQVSGLYRLSVYAAITTPAPSTTQSSWVYGFNWTDSSGTINSVQALAAQDFRKGSFLDAPLFYATSNAQPSSGFTRTFQAVKGTPISHFMELIGPADGSAFSVYYTLERL
jgi:hypothetical protein